MVNSLSIFAGLDANGILRFVGDVARGAACGCHCAVCGASLIARRGDIRIWHFAHESSQERPECFAGAVNLLRRLAIERLRAAGLPPIPDFLSTVKTTYPLPLLTDTVIWTAGEYEIEAWVPEPPQGEVVATIRLSSGSRVNLFATIGQYGPRSINARAGVASVNYELPLPSSVEDIRDHESALNYIDRNGKLNWLCCPEADRSIAAVQHKLDSRAKQILEEERANLARMKPVIDPRPSPAQAWPEVFSPPEAKKVFPNQPLVEVDESPWAAWRKPRHAFLFYGLKDGSAWVLFPHQDGRRVMAPYPEIFDGWDEAMPSHVGIADHDLGCYVIQHQAQALIFLGRISRLIQTPSNWAELKGIRWP